jgi:hypothetical protein
MREEEEEERWDATGETGSAAGQGQ